MSIVKMSRMTIVGMSDDKSEVIESLMKLGALELVADKSLTEIDDEAKQLQEDQEPVKSSQSYFTDADQIFEDETSPAFDYDHTDTLNLMTRLELVIDRCKDLLPAAGGQQKISVDSGLFLKLAKREQDILSKLNKFEQTGFQLAELKSLSAREQTKYEILLPWSGLDLDLSVKGTSSTRVFLGSLDTAEQANQLGFELRQEAPESHLEIFRQDETHTLLAVAVLRSREEAAGSLLRRIGFHPMPLQGEAGKVDDLIIESRNRLSELHKDITSSQQELEKIAADRLDFALLHDYYLIRSEKIIAMKETGGSKTTFWLNGWIPTRLADQVRNSLQQKFSLAIDIQAAAKDEDHPILLQNPQLVKPYEVIVEMFSPPSTKDIDPAPVLAPFFFFFFGMMLSDVGYGLMLSGLCAFLIWKKKAEGELGRMARMLFISGIGSILWGFMFGGFFGNMLDTLSQGRIIMPAIWFNPMDNPTQLMIWSMIFGVIHLFAGMAARIYMLARAGHLMDAILDIVPWFLIISGLGLMLGGFLDPAGKIMALTGAAVLLLFGGRDAKNPVVRLMKGLVSIYNITGYFSDILSYTRILALVLATSVIGMVVNLLGFLMGPTPGGIVLFIVVALLGHTLNLALSALSAYVHTSRLQYVEFFSKFYEGGGRLWKPLKIKTKYIKLVRHDQKGN